MPNEIPILTSEQYIKNKFGIDVQECVFKKTDTRHTHLHTYYTIDLIKTGNGTHFINGKGYPIKKGAVQLIRPSDIHYVTCDGEAEMFGITLRFNEDIIPKDFHEILLKNAGVYYPKENEFSRLCTYAEAIKEYLENNNAYAQKAITMNFYLILIILAELNNIEKQIYEESTDAVNQVLYYLDSHFRESPTLKQIAEYAKVTPQYLSASFRRSTGKTYTDYLTALKMNYACHALKMNYSVTDVCFMSGFGSISNFNSIFKRYKGVTPTEYKKL